MTGLSGKTRACYEKYQQTGLVNASDLKGDIEAAVPASVVSICKPVRMVPASRFW